MTGHIFNIQKFCLHDGPGIRTTVFLKGCNLRCKWCANPESQQMCREMTLDRSKCDACGQCIPVCPAEARRILNGQVVVDCDACILCGNCASACPNRAVSTEGREASVDQVLQEVMKDRVFYETSGGGVTLSGGDVLLQPEFAGELARRLREEGIHVAVETAGAVPEAVFGEMLSWADLVMMDLKHYDSASHRAGTGLGNEQILQNLQKLTESGKEFLIRIPVIPGFNDTLADGEGFAKLLKKYNIQRVELLPFHRLGQNKYDLLGRHYDYESCQPLHPDALRAYARVFTDSGVAVKE